MTPKESGFFLAEIGFEEFSKKIFVDIFTFLFFLSVSGFFDSGFFL